MNDRTPDSVAREIVRIHAEIEDLQRIESALKAELRSGVQVGWKAYADGRPIVAVQPNRRFNVDRAAELLDPQVRELCRADGYDAKKVRAALPPALAEQCMEEAGQPKVVISR